MFYSQTIANTNNITLTKFLRFFFQWANKEYKIPMKSWTSPCDTSSLCKQHHTTASIDVSFTIYVPFLNRITQHNVTFPLHTHILLIFLLVELLFLQTTHLSIYLSIQLFICLFILRKREVIDNVKSRTWALDFKTKSEMTQKFQETKTELSTFLSSLEKG